MFEIYEIDPVAKPRMTRSDKWNNRPVVHNYRLYSDRVRENINPPAGPFGVIFNIKTPNSWSLLKRSNHNGHPHLQRPDIDNLIKGLLDALYKEDSQIWFIAAAKFWSDTGSIIIMDPQMFFEETGRLYKL